MLYRFPLISLLAFSLASTVRWSLALRTSWEPLSKRLSTAMTCDFVMTSDTPQTDGRLLARSIQNVIDKAVIEAADDDSDTYRKKRPNDDDIISVTSLNITESTQFTIHAHIVLAEEDDDDVYEFIYYFEKQLPGTERDGLGVLWTMESVLCG